MSRTGTVVVILAVALAIGAAPAAADDVVVADLINEGEVFSGREVGVSGELVGDYARRDGYVWAQLNGDAYATVPLLEGGVLAGVNLGIGVRIPDALVAGLDPPGGYRSRGPLVRLTGFWRYHDPDRGGESYLDVVALEVSEPGRRLDDPASIPVLITGLILLLAGGLVGLPAIRPLRRRLGVRLRAPIEKPPSGG
jgi:hypothetical protein